MVGDPGYPLGHRQIGCGQRFPAGIGQLVGHFSAVYRIGFALQQAPSLQPVGQRGNAGPANRQTPGYR